MLRCMLIRLDTVFFLWTGYAALFRHQGDELNYCVYIIPGNPKCTPESLAHWHDHLAKEDPNISRALGNNFKMERMKAASLRLGGEKVSHDKHCLLVGDAAGMIDPMTGKEQWHDHLNEKWIHFASPMGPVGIVFR